MESLHDWFQYVNRVSRPARREEGVETAAAEPWRPWPEPDAEAALSPIPSLAAMLTAPALVETYQRVAPTFDDPTLDDKLEPMPEFRIPALRAPTFDVSLPNLTSGTPNLPGEVALAPLSTDLAPEADAQPPPTRPLEVQPATAERAPWLWAHLLQMRSRNFFADDSEPGSRSSREELIQRLLDPTLNLEETALLIGVCPTTVRRYTNRGHLPHFRTKGNQRRFRFLDVAEFIVSRQAEIEADARTDRDAGQPPPDDTEMDA